MPKKKIISLKIQSSQNQNQITDTQSSPEIFKKKYLQ